MIYMLLIIIIFFILLTVIFSMDANHGRISERPLRRKIIDDTANLLLFISILFCTFYFIAPGKIILSFVFITAITMLFFKQTQIIKAFHKLLELIQNKIAFSAPLYKGLQRIMKNRSIPSAMTYSPESIYREYILTFIVYFCKRTALFIIFVLLFLACITEYSHRKQVLYIIDQLSNKDFLSLALIYITNLGFVFNCWKFNLDYKSVQKVKINESFERVIKKLDRKEHNI